MATLADLLSKEWFVTKSFQSSYHIGSLITDLESIAIQNSQEEREKIAVIFNSETKTLKIQIKKILKPIIDIALQFTHF